MKPFRSGFFLASLALATICLSLVLLLVGCQHPVEVKPGAKPNETAPVPAAQNATDVAQQNTEEKGNERDAKLRANIDHAREKNQENPEGTPKTVVDGDLQVAQSLLEGVTPDPVELANRERDAKLVEQGKATEARANYDKAAEEGRKLANELAVVKQQLAEARAAEKKAVQDLIRQVNANAEAMDAALQKQKREYEAKLDKERKAFMHWIGRALVVAAIICVVIGGFSVYGKAQTGDMLKALLVGAVWAGAAGFLIVCAWTINHPWFAKVVITGGSLTVAGVLVFAWVEWRDAKEKKTRLGEADEAEDTLKRVIRALDQVDEANPIFAKLSSLMNDNHKALIKELAAEDKRAVA